VLKVAGTMVAGWSVFGLTGTAPLEGEGRGKATPPAAVPAPAATRAEQARTAGSSPSREIRLARSPTAANDAGPADAPSRGRSRIAATAAPSFGAAASPSAPLSRARGIGSRFRAAPARSLEKMR